MKEKNGKPRSYVKTKNKAVIRKTFQTRNSNATAALASSTAGNTICSAFKGGYSLTTLYAETYATTDVTSSAADT